MNERRDNESVAGYEGVCGSFLGVGYEGVGVSGCVGDSVYIVVQ